MGYMKVRPLEITETDFIDSGYEGAGRLERRVTMLTGPKTSEYVKRTCPVCTC
jgi:hypothetical protein